MTFEQNFKRLKTVFLANDASGVEEDLAFQFNITGDGAGIFYVKIAGGKIEVEPFEYFDRDSVFIASVETFEKLAKGQLDPVLAYTVGKLKVEGSLEKALALKKLSPAKVKASAKPKVVKEKPAKKVAPKKPEAKKEEKKK